MEKYKLCFSSMHGDVLYVSFARNKYMKDKITQVKLAINTLAKESCFESAEHDLQPSKGDVKQHKCSK